MPLTTTKPASFASMVGLLIFKYDASEKISRSIKAIYKSLFILSSKIKNGHVTVYG